MKCPSLDPAAHRKGCAWRRAMTCRVAIACEPHGKDCCIVCDPCQCGEPQRYHVRDELRRKGQLELERLGDSLKELERG